MRTRRFQKRRKQNHPSLLYPYTNYICVLLETFPKYYYAATNHIHTYGSAHTDVIVTENADTALTFMNVRRTHARIAPF